MATTEPIAGQTIPTLSGQPGYTTTSNPPFHPSILNIGGANTTVRPASYNGYSYDGTLYRGYISTRIDSSQPAAQQIQHSVNFLYNPSTISESRSLDVNNGVLPAYARNPDDPGAYKTGLNTSIGFSLLFDRTYELWDQNYLGTQAGTYGVLVDVNAFYNMLGINTLVSAANSNLTPAQMNHLGSQGGQFSVVTQGPMSAVPVDLYFGYLSIGALKYFGIISEIDITYTHFTQQMVPMRCAIQIGFTAYADVYTANAGAQPTTTGG